MDVELRTDASREAVEAADRREWRAAARSLRPLLHPTSVAVVGVRRSRAASATACSRRSGARPTPGRSTSIHPEADVDRRAAGQPQPGGELDGPVDLVVVAVPADGVAEVLRDAAADGAGAGSGGLVRASPAPAATRRRLELLGLARAHSLRLVGPNSQGVLDNVERPQRDAAPRRAPGRRPGGRLPVRAAWASRCSTSPATSGLGVHSFVSLGDKVDVSSNDLLAAWMDDEGSRPAALYLESFGNALKFARTARRFAERKPLLAVVGGRSRARQDPAIAATVGVGVDALLTSPG